MHWKPKSWILIGLLFAALTATGAAQVATTQVADTIYHANGTPATGTVLISWPAFTTSAGESVPSGSTSATIAASGALSVQLISNAGATPIGSYYTVVYHLDDGSVSRQYWVVPQSMAAVKVSAIESTVLPTSIAMQTVSKSYVDTAIAAAVTGHPLDSTPYVLKAGDTMTGALVLPGDPISATQAADKNYVDSTVAAVSGGLGQKVATLPQATQTVTQPAGTQLQVNSLNGELYAGQYVTGRGANGIANAAAGPDCANGCEVKATQDYVAEPYSTAALNPQTHVEDARGGRRVDSYKDPLDVVNHGFSTAQTIDAVATQSEASIAQQTGRSIPGAVGLAITQQGLAGGSNLFPEQVESQPPYFKMGYSALTVNGTYNTQGQHVLVPEETDCYGVGDCLIGSHFIVASGGFRDSADEGTHPYDLQTHEDSRVFAGTCTTGCTAGSTSVMVTPTSAAGTQGDGRFLIDTLPAKTISSAGTGVSLVGGNAAGPHASAQFNGTNFPVSVFLSTGQAILSQTAIIAPGIVTVPIATTGVPSGYATNTVAIGAGSGLACVVDQSAGYAPNNFEMAPYTVVDATHLQMTLNKPHVALATLAFGGLCGYGLEQTVDTTNGIRQLFPVVGSSSPTSLYYAGGSTPVVGQMGLTSGFLNVNAAIASVARSGNVVSVTTAGNLATNINGLNATITGVADSSYNGTFAVTTTGSNSFTYAQAGTDSTSSGGTASVLTGGFALYPMAEVLSVFDPAAKSVNGLMTLAPNNVAWATSDTVEEPHFYQEYVTADTEMLGQYVPRPTVIMHAGLQYQQNNGPGLIGWSIQNAAPTGNYIGYGGTHGYPDAAYDATGVWRRTMTLNAGEQAAFTVHCNLHGCGNWNSAYNLFELDSNAGADVVSYSPASSSLSMSMRGTPYSFTPQAFTAGAINAGTLNATTLNGALDAGSIASGTVAAARLPLFGASGATHAPGIVPDPGATAGSTRFLREDGTWSAPSGGGTATFAGAWASGSTYSVGQAVSYTPNGNSYTSLVNGNTGNQPDITPASWGLLASNGGLTPAVTTAIASAASQVLPLVVDYAGGNSTTMTIGASGLPGTGAIGHASILLGDALPVGSYLENITMQLGSTGTVNIVLATMTPTTSNSPAGSATVLQQFTLNTSTAKVVSAGVYRWTIGTDFAPILISTANTFIGVVNNGTAAVLGINASAQGNGVYSFDGPLTGTSWHQGWAFMDMSVYCRNVTSLPGVVQETRPLQVYARKGVSYVPGTPATIFTATGPGNVERIQIAMNDDSGSPLTRLSGATTIITINVDGQTYTAPLGLFMLWDGYQTLDGASSTSDLFETKYLSVTAGTSAGNNTIAGSRRIYIKYNSSITISLTMPAGMNGTVYTQVDYYSGVAPVGRYPATRNVFHMVSNDLAATTTNQYLEILPAISGVGELESLYLVTTAPGAVEPHWLEVPPWVVVDGTSYFYGGAEDFFGNQFYGDQFHGRTDEYGIARYHQSGAPDSTTYWSGYRYFRDTPLVFNSTLSARWQNANDPTLTAAKAGSLVVYYTEN